MSRNLIMARAAWGDALPDWVAALAREADATSQKRVADLLGLSDSAINTVLRNKYPASTDRIAATVRGRLMKATVACPVLGDLDTDLCQEWQKKAERFYDTGQLRVRMYRACRACGFGRFARKPGAVASSTAGQA
jgi:hypothetical protein